MGNYRVPPAPSEVKQLPEYIYRELGRVASSTADNAEVIFYRTIVAADASLSAGISANWKCANANVIRMSTSNTITVTGIAFSVPMREFVFINVGTGVVAFKNEGTESSASFRFALPAALYQLSANHAAGFWYDNVSARMRPLYRT